MSDLDARRRTLRRLVLAVVGLMAAVVLGLVVVGLLSGDDSELEPVDEVRLDPSLSVALLQIGFLVIPVALVWIIGAVAIAREARRKGRSFWRYLAAGLALSPVFSARHLRRGEQDE